MKTVLYFNHSMAIGGIETMIVDFARMARAAGWSPEVAVMQAGGALEVKLRAMGVPVHSLEKRDGIDWRLPGRLAKLMRERKVAVLHTNNYSAWLYGVAARATVQAIHVHSEHSQERGFRRRTIEAVLSRFTHHVVAVSKDVEEYLRGIAGLRTRCVTTIANGINNSRFQQDADRRRQVRANLGWDESLVVFGIVARLAPIKNHTMLLQAFAALDTEVRKGARLLIVGDGAERQRLVTLARDLAIESDLSFTGARHDTEALLNAMDAYVLCSLNEGMNLTLLEAMSSGLPCIATRVGGNPELVIDGETGLLVDSGNVQQLCEAMTRLYREAPLRSRFALAARRRAVDSFDETQTFSKYERLYSRQ